MHDVAHLIMQYKPNIVEQSCVGVSCSFIWLCEM